MPTGRAWGMRSSWRARIRPSGGRTAPASATRLRRRAISATGATRAGSSSPRCRAAGGATRLKAWPAGSETATGSLRARVELAAQGAGVFVGALRRLGLAREQLFEARDVTLLVRGHLGGESADVVVPGVLGDVDVEILRAPLGGKRELERVACARRRVDPVGVGPEVVPGVFPAGELRHLALGGAQRKGLVLLLLLAADLLELVGDVVEPDVPHETLQLDEALERLALARQRLRVEIHPGLRQPALPPRRPACLPPHGH